MNIKIIKKLPPIEEIIKNFPLSAGAQEKVKQDIAEVKDILSGRDSRLLVIVGPCCAWPMPAVVDYAKKLKVLEIKLKDRLKIVMRVYIQKPRTTKGWLGPVNQPDPFQKADITKGISYVREMMVKVVELGLPIADEALFTSNAKGFLELLSWVAIGARSTEDQEHRIFASAVDCAVGMKNPTSGSLEIAVNSLVAGQHPHVAVFDGYEVQTHGNPYAHLVLRGGAQGTNYSPLSIKEAAGEMDKHKIKNPAIIIDASHDNSKVNGKKSHKQQIEVVREVMKSIKNEPELRKIVRGFMLESFIKEGSQKIDPKHPENIDLGGLSLVDSCLGWEETEKLLVELHEARKNA